MSPGPRPIPRTVWYLHPSSRLATTDMGQKLGAVPPWGELGPACNTMSPGPTSTLCLSSGILIHPAVWPQQTRAENCSGVHGGVPLSKGELGHHVTQCGLGRGLPSTKWHLDPCSRLATTRGPKLGGCCAPPPPFGASGVPI